VTVPDHYYTETPASPHDPRDVTVPCGERALTCRTDAGVFSRERVDPGSALLLATLYGALPPDFSGDALDLGCGWGPVGLCLACRYPKAALTLCDVNRRALDLAEENFARNGLRAKFIQSDGLAGVEARFVVIAVNPPIRAGKATAYRLLDEGFAHLRPGGALYAVIRKQQGAPSALAHLRTLSADTAIASRKGGYWVLRTPAPQAP
jgi:16S rRNA (guanine1207-N2)-methyltransferase